MCQRGLSSFLFQEKFDSVIQMHKTSDTNSVIQMQKKLHKNEENMFHLEM